MDEHSHTSAIEYQAVPAIASTRPPIRRALIAGEQWVISIGIASILHALNPGCDCTKISLKEWLLGQESDEIYDLVVLTLASEDVLHARVRSKLRHLTPNARVVLISTSLMTRQILDSVIEFGVAGCLSLSNEVEAIYHALALIQMGHKYFDASNMVSTPTGRNVSLWNSAPYPTSKTPQRKGLTLSRRQKEVASLLVRGASNKEISQILGVSLGTVKNYVASILVHLSVNSRAKAISLLTKTLDEMHPD